MVTMILHAATLQSGPPRPETYLMGLGASRPSGRAPAPSDMCWLFPHGAQHALQPFPCAGPRLQHVRWHGPQKFRRLYWHPPDRSAMAPGFSRASLCGLGLRSCEQHAPAAFLASVGACISGCQALDANFSVDEAKAWRRSSMPWSS